MLAGREVALVMESDELYKCSLIRRELRYMLAGKTGVAGTIAIETTSAAGII